jgi:uncharacterized membrane protein YkgB
MPPTLIAIDRAISSWMARHGPELARLSLGVVFAWFGALKVLNIGPAKELVTRTVYWVDPGWFYPFLGLWEVAIGVGLMVRPLNRAAILLLLLQMPGTFLPLVLLPHTCFERVPWVPTLEGQYIIKNLVLISAALVVGGTVRQPRSAS